MKTVEQDFNILGLSVTTTNVDMQAKEDIGALWQSFMQHPSFIPLLQSGADIYAVYDQYENKEFGNYRITVGCLAEKKITPRPEMTVVTIQAGYYQCLPVKSRSPEHIVATWQYVWNDADLPRNYLSDFERYQGDRVELFIGCEQDSYDKR